MSFIRIIYRLFLPHKITITLADIPKYLNFFRDLTDGKYLDVIEKHELQKSLLLAKAIDEKSELLPHVNKLIDGERGHEIRESLIEHRVLVHTLFYNKTHVLSQLSKIIDELEVQVRMQESGKIRRI